MWFVSGRSVAYEAAVAAMEARVAAIAAARAREAVWLLEHPPLYTMGTSARAEELLRPSPLPIHRTGRGGRITYHGPGQRIAYVMLDLRRRGRDVRAFVHQLEAWLITALAELGVAAERRAGRIGLWVVRPESAVATPHQKGGPAASRPEPGGTREDKIAAIGIRLRRWVSYHGASLNVAPDLSHYDAIVPCGIREHGVTSLAALGCKAEMGEVDAALRRAFEATFGPTLDPEARDPEDAGLPANGLLPATDEARERPAPRGPSPQ